MKKLFILALLAVVTASCSKSDSPQDPNATLAFTKQNISGKWYYKEVIENGTTTPYDNKCATKRDYIVFYTSGDLELRRFNATCGESFVTGPTYTLSTADLSISNYDLFPNGTATVFTASEMRIKYQFEGDNIIKVFTRN